MYNNHLLLVKCPVTIDTNCVYVVEVSGAWPDVGDLVEFKDGSLKLGEIIQILTADPSDDSYKMISAIHAICPATRIWSFSWKKEKAKEAAADET